MEQWQLFDYSFWHVTISTALKLISICLTFTFYYALKHWSKIKKTDSFGKEKILAFETSLDVPFIVEKSAK